MSSKTLTAVEQNVARISRQYPYFPVELAIILRLVKLMGWQVGQAANGLLKSWDITYAEYNVLATLYGSDGYAMCLAEMCDVLGETPGQGSRLIQLLDKRSLIERRCDATDRRKVVAVLNDRGVRLVETLLPVISGMVNEHVGSFEAGEMGELLRLLKKSMTSLA
jgi:DNA-binding MarR family transcriptional regulator